MVYFLIGTPINNSKKETWKEIQISVLKKSLAKGNQIQLFQDSFKLSNLDTLMFVNDKLIKLQNNLQNTIKKIDRQYLDLKQITQHKWMLNTSIGYITQQDAIINFKWNQSKYPKNYTIKKLTAELQHELNMLQQQLRTKSQNFSQIKQQYNQTIQKEFLFCNQRQPIYKGLERCTCLTIGQPKRFCLFQVYHYSHCNSPKKSNIVIHQAI